MVVLLHTQMLINAEYEYFTFKISNFFLAAAASCSSPASSVAVVCMSVIFDCVYGTLGCK